MALIYDATRAYDLQVVGGVADYLHLHSDSNWNIYLEENALKDQKLPDLASWRGDGIIADLDDRKVAAAVSRANLPIVGFGSGYGWYSPDSQIPYFFTNNRAIAHLAASHLLDRGFRFFAYCGYPRSAINGWSLEREHEFKRLIRQRGFPCFTHRGKRASTRAWAARLKQLGRWLQELPKPVGLMAANDQRARQVLEACRVYGLCVPKEVAVVGVDNDELLCRLSSPLLTSIEQGGGRIGYDAASLLSRLMSGKGRGRKQFVVDPIRIVLRQSTDFVPTMDPVLARALSFISEHACEGIKVGSVVNHVAVSRAGLETRFRRVLGRTPHHEIRRVQLERCASLLTQTGLAPKEIAAKAGFRSVQHMTTLFARAFGQPPVRFRLSSAAPWARPGGRA